MAIAKERRPAPSIPPPPAQPIPISHPGWPDPAPLPERPRPATWPPGVLPDWIQAHVDNVATAMQCAPDMPATFALGALSTVSLGRLELQARNGHTEPTALYLTVALPPSEAKSPALDAMFGTVRDFEAETITYQLSAKAEAAAELKILEGRAKRAEDSAITDDTPERIRAAKDARTAVESHQPPPTGRLITGDSTPEKLATLMADNSERIAIVSDEAGVLQIDRYGDRKAGGGRNIDIYLQSWSGRPVVIDRQTAPSVALRHPLLTIVVASQPEAWRAVLADPELRNRGFTARFMASSPTPMAGRRTVDLQLDLWNTEASDDYHHRLGQIARRLRSFDRPLQLDLASDAKEVWSTWAQDLEHRLGVGGDLEEEAGWIGKMRDSVMRVAALLHIATADRGDNTVTAEAMTRSTRIGDYWLAHRLAGIDDAVENTGAKRLLAALTRLADDTDDGLVTRRQIGRGGPRNLRTSDEVMPAIRILEEYGWIRIVVPKGVEGLPIEARWRSCKGVIVHPVARTGGCATARDTRDESTRRARGHYGEGEKSRLSRASRIRPNFDPDPNSYPQDDSDSSDPPRDTRDTRDNNPPDDPPYDPAYDEPDAYEEHE